MRIDPKSAVIGVAGALLLFGGLGRWHERSAQSAAPDVVRAQRVLVFPRALDETAHLIYVVDPELFSLAVYRMDATRRELKLEAVRHFKWDLRLNHYNSAQPHPVDVQRMVQLEESK